jgi:prepilin-type processing-associated H-X9-DG protein
MTGSVKGVFPRFLPAGAALDEALRYFRGRRRASADSAAARTVVLQDKSPVHSPRGRNKAFADGHVEFVEEPGS